jgi:parallel beta-helix repeat protein
MTDFQAWNMTTHPIVRLENDYNNLLAHGLVKPYTYLVRVNGSYYEALLGAGTTAGTVAYGGVDNAGATDGTDACAVIQAALTNVSGTAVEQVAVYGSYTIDTSLVVGAYTVLDLYNATLTNAANLDDDMLVLQGWHSQIRGGHLEGNSANNASGSGIKVGDGVETQRFFVGDGMIVHDFQDYGLHVDSTFGNIVGVGTFRAIDIENCGSHGIYGGSYAADCIFSQINLGGCGGSGINLDSGCNSNTFVGNLIWNNTTYGIYLSGADANTIIGCRVDNNGYDGIVLSDGSNYNTVVGNVVYDNSVAAADTYSGITVNDSVKNIIVNNFSTRISGTDQHYGIHEKNDDSLPEASDFNVIHGNYCRGNKYPADGYLVIGTNTTSFDRTVHSATSVDLSGAAETLYLYHAPVDTHLARITLLYTEASSADAGVAIEVGKETDRNYYYTGTSEVNKAQYYTLAVPRLKSDLVAGDTLTFYSAGGKAGTGEIKLIVDLLGNA